MTAFITRVRMEEPALMELIPTSVLVNRGTVEQSVRKSVSSLNAPASVIQKKEPYMNIYIVSSVFLAPWYRPLS